MQAQILNAAAQAFHQLGGNDGNYNEFISGYFKAFKPANKEQELAIAQMVG